MPKLNQLFNSISIRAPRLNKFDLSHEKKLTCNMGNLIPVMCQEIVPGDRFRKSTECMMRMAPMLAPMMHRVNVTFHDYFVPMRLIWDEWEDFITGGRLGTSTPVMPNFLVSDVDAALSTESTLWDYLGLPPLSGLGPVDDVQVSALPFRAYQLIYDEYYRDQRLTPPVDISKASGNIPSGAEMTKLLTLRKRCWEKDYFTSARPEAQLGDTVGIPITDDVSVGTQAYRTDTGALYGAGADVVIGAAGQVVGTGPSEGSMHLSADGHEINVNDFRRSIRLQEWLEKNSRAGSRYIEQILSHFGIKSSDARLQRPEFLGGTSQPMTISEVLSTFEDATSEPQGQMTGHGISVGSRPGFKRFFEEHGYVITMMSVMPRTGYIKGINKMWSRFDKLDFYWPEFANIGEQEVLQKEIAYDDQQNWNPESVFGYQSRYAEYKYGVSTVHGQFQGNLSYWHMARIFDNEPLLNTSFVEADPTYRIFAVTDPEVDHLYVQLYHHISALRPMPYWGTPTI